MDREEFSYFESYHDWSDAEHHLEQAHDHYDRGSFQEAARELQAAIEINPSNSSSHFNLGLTLDSLERYSVAVESYLQALAIAPDDPEILNCLGVDYTRLGQYELALETLAHLEKIAPDFEPGFCNRIITYSEMGEHDKAEEMFYLARQLKEHCPLCYFNIGNSLFSRQLYEKAIWCWKQARELDPNHPQIDYRVAQAHWAMGQHAAAREHFLAELRRRPGDSEVLLDIGILLLEMNELEAAREKFNRIIELNPHYAQAWQYLGEIALKLGQIPPAVERFQRALALNSDLPGCHYRLGECYLLMGQKLNARDHLLLEASFGAEHPEVLLDLGCLLDQAGAIVEAVNCFEKFVALYPDDYRGYYNLSLCFYQARQMEGGMELSQKVLEIEPHHVPTLHNLSLAALHLGKLVAARAYIERAREFAPEEQSLRELEKDIRRQTSRERLASPFRRIFKKSLA